MRKFTNIMIYYALFLDFLLERQGIVLNINRVFCSHLLIGFEEEIQFNWHEKKKLNKTQKHQVMIFLKKSCCAKLGNQDVYCRKWPSTSKRLNMNFEHEL